MKKLTLLIGIAVGYVLGSRAGRERYEQIRGGARRLAGNPRVQSAASRAQETVAAQAPVVAETVKDKATAAASAVADKVHGGSSGGSGGAHVGTGPVSPVATTPDQPTVTP